MQPSGRRRAYLPHGQWVDWWTGERLDGRALARPRRADRPRPAVAARRHRRARSGPTAARRRRPTDPLVLRVAEGEGTDALVVPLEHGPVTIRYEDGEVTWDGPVPGAVQIERVGSTTG
jgi:alpha-glucosidase (family GH31 glycosyl hydrolase)